MKLTNQYVLQTPQVILTCINISELLVAERLCTAELGLSLNTYTAISWSLHFLIYKMVKYLLHKIIVRVLWLVRTLPRSTEISIIQTVLIYKGLFEKRKLVHRGSTSESPCGACSTKFSCHHVWTDEEQRLAGYGIL